MSLHHMARPVDPYAPHGPARPACGEVLRHGDRLVTDRNRVTCPPCGWVSRPQQMLFLEVDDSVALTPARRLAVQRAYHAQRAETGEAPVGLRVGDITLPIPVPRAPANAGNDLAGLRDRARWIFLDRANKVQGQDAALALALASASERLAKPTTIADLLQQVYDEAVLLQAQPHTEEISGWVCDRQRDVGLKPYDQGFDPLTEEGDVAMRWYARHFILYFLLEGNPDYAKGDGPALLALAAEVVSGAAWQGTSFSRPTMQALCRYIASKLPPTATASRTWSQREASIVGFKDPSAWEIVKGGVKDGVDEIVETAKEVADEIEPPGGWGMGLLIGGIAVGAFGIYLVTKR